MKQEAVPDPDLEIRRRPGDNVGPGPPTNIFGPSGLSLV